MEGATGEQAKALQELEKRLKVVEEAATKGSSAPAKAGIAAPQPAASKPQEETKVATPQKAAPAKDNAAAGTPKKKGCVIA